MDIVEALDQPADVVQVAQDGLAHLAGVDVEDVDSRAAGAQVDPLAAQVQIGAAILAVEHHVAVGRLQGSFDHGAREAHPVAGGVHLRAGRGQNVAALGVHHFHAGALQHAQGGVVDTLDIGIGERAVLTAFEAWREHWQSARLAAGGAVAARH